MGEEKKQTKSYTLYRLLGEQELVGFVQEKYLGRAAFTAHSFEIQGRRGLLIEGSIKNDEVKWVPTVQSLTGCKINRSNSTAAGLILVPTQTKGVVWAISFGMGFLLLDKNYIDQGFGQRVTVRAVDPGVLKSVTRTKLDQRSKTERSSIPSGAHVRGFTVGDFGEIVTRVKGAAVIPELTSGDKTIQIRGSDSLSLPLGNSQELLVKDLDTIERILERDPHPELIYLDQLKKVKSKNLIVQLESDFNSCIDSGPERVGLHWPDERIEDTDAPDSFKLGGVSRIPGLGLRGLQEGSPDLDCLLTIVKAIPSLERANKARKMTVQLYKDDGGKEAVSGAIPIWNWFTFECVIDSRRFCLHNGSWYEIATDYAQRLDEETTRIFSKKFDQELPNWRVNEPEEEYNKRLADSLNGVCLDRKLIRTTAHRRGIEPADVFIDGNTLIHVKQFDSSSPASHLVAQALVSAEAIFEDEDAWIRLNERLLEAGVDTSTLTVKPEKIVLAIARRGRKLEPEDLFSFTKVTLINCVNQLHRQGKQVYIATIGRE